jgi:hypothetical protein
MLLIDHEYHVVEIHSFAGLDAVFEWLQVQYGPGNGTRWMYKHPRIYFADPKDHMMFLLRWS